MKLSPTQAEKRYEVTRQTVYKDIEKGKLSASKDGKGKTVIDMSELDRVYEKRRQKDTSPSVANLQTATDKTVNLDSLLQKEIDLLREQLTEKDRRLSDKDDDRLPDLRSSGAHLGPGRLHRQGPRL